MKDGAIWLIVGAVGGYLIAETMYQKKIDEANRRIAEAKQSGGNMDIGTLLKSGGDLLGNLGIKF